MAKYRRNLPQLKGGNFLAYLGMETDLLFSQGYDLKGFASYPMVETETGRALLKQYFRQIIEIAQAAGTGVILESPTWVANRDRGATLGYSPKALRDRNLSALQIMADVRDASPDLPTVLSANLGPRADAYAPSEQMTAQEAEAYHSAQISTFAQTQADLVSGYTIAYPEEAIGIVRAARDQKLPVIIAFTVETDGCLPTGQPLGAAIDAVDQATDGYAAYFMINCAHPDHFAHVLSDAPWMGRLKGLVANASRCSHAELDEAEVLDDGNPDELGQQLTDLKTTYPNINILGGCCGTDMRHMICIAERLSKS